MFFVISSIQIYRKFTEVTVLNTDIRASANENTAVKKEFAPFFSDKKLGDAAEAALLLKGYGINPDSSIIICDEDSAVLSGTQSADGMIVLYRSLGYTDSDTHADLAKRLGSRYAALLCPYRLDELYAVAEYSLSPDTASSDGNRSDGIITDGLTLTYRGESVTLTEREYKLFEYLLSRRGTFVSSDELNKNVWDSPPDRGTNIAQVYISYLRKKLRPIFGDGVIISVRGKGYILSV